MKLKKITKAHGERIGPVKLYLDDIEAIVAVFSEVSSETKITTDEYAVESIDQLKQLKREYFNEMHISISDPYVSLSLEPDGIWL